MRDTTAAIKPSASVTSNAVSSEVAEQIELAHVIGRVHDRERLLDPTRDGWGSEAFAEAAKKQLEQLFRAKARSDRPLDAYAETDATAQGLRSNLERVFEQAGVLVQRSAIATSQVEENQPAGEHLSEALGRLLQPLQRIGSPEVHFKVVGVDIERTMPTTEVLYEAFAAGDESAIQQTTRLKCSWSTSEAGPPKLASITGDEFEEVTIQAARGRWFDDCTATVLSGQPAFETQLAYGLNHWTQRIERAHQMDDSVRNGLAIGDVNGDGLDDVYVCQGPGLPNRLLVQNADGTVTDRASQAKVDWLDQSGGALLIDLDNDSDQDLAIATFGGLMIMENSGAGDFVLRAQLGSRQCDAQSLSASDYDNDGDLDLFLCVYRPAHVGRRGDFVFHNANTGGRNRLFRNDIVEDEWVFQDVTDESGLGGEAHRYSLAAAWEDYDLDGDQDLYVANDYGPNNLFRNEGKRFSNVTATTGLADTGFGMSASWGDVNRDGRMDLYIGNMFSSAGNRIARQRAFQEHTSDEQRLVYQRMAQGNSLFVQQPVGSFREVGQAAGVRMGRWAWSSVFADINNDGWPDLLVANGYITAEDEGDL